MSNKDFNDLDDLASKIDSLVQDVSLKRDSSTGLAKQTYRYAGRKLEQVMIRIESALDEMEKE